MSVLITPENCRAVSYLAPAGFCCGDIRGPDYGSVFALREGTGATSYWFDRQAKSHAATYAPHHNPPPVGADIELHHRVFRVAGEAVRGVQ